MSAATPVDADAMRASTASAPSPQAGSAFVVEAAIKPNLTYKPTRQYRDPTPSPTLEGAWRSMLPTAHGCIEAMSPAPENTVEVFTRQNLFAKAVHAAFYGHYGLVLSPDVIWLTIMQGLANHVDQNAETLRDRVVAHEGKEDLLIERPEFVKGSPTNDWPGVFPEFEAKIAARTVGAVAQLAATTFSTTGPIERIASQITLMDTVQHYFSYTMACGCGFPSIRLTGTPADWESVRAKAEALREYDLDWWLAALLPALDEFVAASRGTPNLDFWRSLCNINVGTSFPRYEPLTGWVQVFFPYLLAPGFDDGFGSGGGFDEANGGRAKKKLRRNDNLANYTQSVAARVNVTNFAKSVKSEGRWPRPEGTAPGVKLELFPPGLSSAPFKYKDAATGTCHKMAFYGRAACLVQHADGAIEPKMGWAVLDSGVAEGGPQPKQPLAESSVPSVPPEQLSKMPKVSTE